MQGSNNKLISDMDRIRRACLVALVSIIATALLATVAAGTANAENGFTNTAASQKALARLVKDIDLLRPALEAKSKVSSDGYYMIRRGETLDGIIANALPGLPLRKNILRQAIVRANPHAFKRRNPNWMYAGKRIKLPDSGDIHRVIFTQSSDKMDKAKSAREERKTWVHYP
ncbi:MAG: hypothetical protein HON72_04925 [Porticoccaceae bacterium]|nr:hypothetical protein [Porticoccaceae bacterium]